MKDPYPLFLTPTAEPPQGPPVQTPPWDSKPEIKKQPYQKFWQVVLEPPDPVTGESKPCRLHPAGRRRWVAHSPSGVLSV